jgi:hypothetical protein
LVQVVFYDSSETESRVQFTFGSKAKIALKIALENGRCLKSILVIRSQNAKALASVLRTFCKMRKLREETIKPSANCESHKQSTGSPRQTALASTSVWATFCEIRKFENDKSG